MLQLRQSYAKLGGGFTLKKNKKWSLLHQKRTLIDPLECDGKRVCAVIFQICYLLSLICTWFKQACFLTIPKTIQFCCFSDMASVMLCILLYHDQRLSQPDNCLLSSAVCSRALYILSDCCLNLHTGGSSSAAFQKWRVNSPLFHIRPIRVRRGCYLQPCEND